jgi:hypothetical protein
MKKKSMLVSKEKLRVGMVRRAVLVEDLNRNRMFIVRITRTSGVKKIDDEIPKTFIFGELLRRRMSILGDHTNSKTSLLNFCGSIEGCARVFA